jgi:hypothetical protein
MQYTVQRRSRRRFPQGAILLEYDMTQASFVTAQARLAVGHRVASGLAGDARFPKGTIEPQLRFFRAAVSQFDIYFDGPVFPGTLNLAFDRCAIDIRQPEHFLPHIPWTDQFAPENFYLSPCVLVVANCRHRGLLYIPDPVTKPDHAQPTNIVEVLSTHIPALQYDDQLTLAYSPVAIIIRPL